MKAVDDTPAPQMNDLLNPSQTQRSASLFFLSFCHSPNTARTSNIHYVSTQTNADGLPRVMKGTYNIESHLTSHYVKHDKH